MCFQSRGYDLSSSVNEAVKWLTCLHNEHNDLINEHAQAINNNNQTLRTLALQLSSLEMENSNLKGVVADDELEISTLKSQMSDMGDRLRRLEQK